ncbi:hypothetical protein AAG906_025860 [Vitis piasezkii]
MNKLILPNEEDEEIEEEDFFLEVVTSLHTEIQEIASTTSFHHNETPKSEDSSSFGAMALNEEEKDPNFIKFVIHWTTYLDNPCSIEFSSTGFDIKDQLQQVLARGTKKEGLYASEENVIQAMTVTRSSKASSSVASTHRAFPNKIYKASQDKNFIEVSS